MYKQAGVCLISKHYNFRICIGNLTWDLSSTRTLIGPSGVIYACIETDGNGILVASENHFAFFHVSDQPLKYANQMNKAEAPGTF
jgi:hypothetical protein